VIQQTADEFYKAFGRYYGGLIDTYRLEDAEVALVAMGSVICTMKDAVDELRADGHRVGILKVRTFRPFPKGEIATALRSVKRVVVLEKAVSLGSGGILAAEIRDALYDAAFHPRVDSYIVGLGGRDITISDIKTMATVVPPTPAVGEFFGLKRDLIKEEDL
jgi:pyruvate ferredoxin oxidoreductase alpha subunit